MISILVFLIAIVLANLSVAYFGPVSAPFNAFVLIGLDLTLRDKIHEEWYGKGLVWKMSGLILVGAIITYILNKDAGMICVGSVVAFTVALFVDALIYNKLFDKSKMIKMNSSNVGSALADSILFPTIAFGVFMPWIILGQFIAKVFGGAVWVWILTRKERQK